MIEWFFQIRNSLEGTYTLRILENFFELFFKVGPYLLISIALNVAAARYFQYRRIRFFSTSELFSIFMGTLLGLVSPLPTYAAIPIGVSLLAAGIPFSAIIAFVIASPLMNPSIFFLTVTQLGWEMALARTLAASILGLLGGVCVMKFFKQLDQYALTHTLAPIRRTKTLSQEIKGTVLYTVKYFSFAIFLSAAVKALVPADAISMLLGADAKISTLAAICLGVPFYTCGGAAIPLIETLHEMGMGKGAMLAFFLAGPATKLETLYAFKNMLGTRVLVFYLVLTFVFSYIAGVIYSFV
jgi:uncharacterized protein